MKVNIPDRQSDKLTTGEMKGASGEMGVIVGEMVTEPAKLKEFGFSADVIARAVALKEAAKDNSPEYAIVRVEEGWSGSKRLWPAREIDRIVAQTNTLEPVGHLGHIPDDQESTAFPEVQTTWIGAITKDELSKQKSRSGEMVRVAYFVGYNLPGAKIREYIKAKAVRGISWWGRANQKIIPGKGVEMVDFDLNALDWARKGAEGMPTSQIVAIASEMSGGKEMEKDLAQVTPAEFKKENPNAHALIVKEVEDQHKGAIGEMERKVEDGESAKSLLTKACVLLGIDKPEEMEAKITELMTRIGDKAKATLKTSLDALLLEKVPGDDEDAKHKRELLGRLLPVGEMESRVADCTDDESAKKLVGEMVDEAFSKDDTIKNILGEMQPPALRRREELREGAGKGEGANDYIKGRERVSV